MLRGARIEDFVLKLPARKTIEITAKHACHRDVMKLSQSTDWTR